LETPWSLSVLLSLLSEWSFGVSSPTSTTNNGSESDICADSETEKTGQGQEIHRRGDAMQRDLPSAAQGDLAVTTTTTTTSNHCHPHQRNFCGLSKAFRIHPAQRSRPESADAGCVGGENPASQKPNLKSFWNLKSNDSAEALRWTGDLMYNIQLFFFS